MISFFLFHLSQIVLFFCKFNFSLIFSQQFLLFLFDFKTVLFVLLTVFALNLSSTSNFVECTKGSDVKNVVTNVLVSREIVRNVIKTYPKRPVTEFVKMLCLNYTTFHSIIDIESKNFKSLSSTKSLFINQSENIYTDEKGINGGLINMVIGATNIALTSSDYKFESHLKGDKRIIYNDTGQKNFDCIVTHNDFFICIAVDIKVPISENGVLRDFTSKVFIIDDANKEVINRKLNQKIDTWEIENNHPAEIAKLDIYKFQQTTINEGKCTLHALNHTLKLIGTSPWKNGQKLPSIFINAKDLLKYPIFKKPFQDNLTQLKHDIQTLINDTISQIEYDISPGDDKCYTKLNYLILNDPKLKDFLSSRISKTIKKFADITNHDDFI